MDVHSLTIKSTIVAALAVITGHFGWYGWLALIWVACMTVDWITGSCAAFKKGEWQSSLGREGLWHKCGCIITVVASLLLDLTITLFTEMIPNINFTYPVAFSAIVMVWYILTEVGSIVENAGNLGAPIPSFLISGIKVLKTKINKFGDSSVEDDSDDTKKDD